LNSLSLGSSHPNFQSRGPSRPRATISADGVVLVHDLSNKKSYASLQRWLAELRHAQSRDEGGSRTLPWLGSGSTTDSPVIKRGAGSRSSLDAVGDYDPEVSAGSR